MFNYSCLIMESLLNMDKIPTDLDLTLVQEHESIPGELILSVHKNILAKNSPYFEKLFINFKESNQKKITIHVPNIRVMYDIIMGFYDQKFNSNNLDLWQYQLELVKCYDYLNICCNLSLLNNIKVPPEGFDLLLDAIELIGYDARSMQIINNNFPENYDISRLPNDLIDEMIRVNASYQIAMVDQCDIKILNPLTGDLIKTLKGNGAHAMSVCYSSDFQTIVSGNCDGIIKIVNVSTGYLIRNLIGYTTSIKNIIYSPNNQLVALTGWDRTIKIWNTDTGNLIHNIYAHTDHVYSCCFSPNNQQIASGSWDKTIKTWDILTGKMIHTYYGHTDNVRCVCYSIDGKQIVSGSSDRTIKIWDVLTGKLIQNLIGHNNLVQCVCYSPNGKQIASGSWDKTIKIWDAITGNLIRSLNGHTDTINSIGYTQDNQLIISGSYDKTVKVWDVSTGNLIQTLSENIGLTESISIATYYQNDHIKKLLLK